MKRKTMAEDAEGYHPINLAYRGLQRVHTAPEIFVVRRFLTPRQCTQLLAKAAKSSLRRSAQSHHRTGSTYVSDLRTSSHCILAQREAPTVVRRLEALSRLPREHLERLKLVRYERGEHFRPHHDGFTARTDSSGFVNSNRLVTIFVYLNDVSEGGDTQFTRLGLRLQPEQGMAVVHRPARADGEGRDDRCEHEGCTAVDEKWVLTAQVWADPKCESLEGVREVDTRVLTSSRV